MCHDIGPLRHVGRIRQPGHLTVQVHHATQLSRGAGTDPHLVRHEPEGPAGCAHRVYAGSPTRGHTEGGLEEHPRLYAAAVQGQTAAQMYGRGELHVVTPRQNSPYHFI